MIFLVVDGQMRGSGTFEVNNSFSVSRLSADQVNYLNIGLMLVTAVAALVRPFELFLVAYAFLGPLHYLTEISWLHDRKYFTRAKYDYLPLVGFAAVIALIDMEVVPGLPDWLRVVVTYLAFGSALLFAFWSGARARLLGFLILIATSPLIVRSDFFHSLFSVLLPTIVHVFVFTGLFILVGALKSRSVSGIGSLVVFCLCTLGFFLLGPALPAGPVGAYVRQSYLAFAQLNYSLMTPFSQHNLHVPANLVEYIMYVNYVLFHSPAARAIMGLIAFAYTYHYLNWFSKTSIIQWHNISRTRFLAIIGLWLVSAGLYAYDYRLGLRWLFFLSLTHVFLEFPLNHLTFISIGRELRALLKIPRVPAFE
jgi:hypothetical protein